MFTFVVAVYNNLELTKKCYDRIRELYPNSPLVISSGGSTDGTLDWGHGLNDRYTTFSHVNERITFSETYNLGVKLVKTDKFVLIHNDMVIGKYFLENLEIHLKENMLLSYTTIEPPIFNEHSRPGKIIMDFGADFSNFNYKLFDEYVETNRFKCNIYAGASFFLSSYKKTFDEIGGFDGFSFVPAFCEDDDFLFRAKLKNIELKTIECAITYHFVSKTSRFSDEMKNETQKYEMNSNKNFIRKWGIPTYILHSFNFLTNSELKYDDRKNKLIGNTDIIKKYIAYLEPFFNKIEIEESPEDYINEEKKNTNYDLESKFIKDDEGSIIVKIDKDITNEDYDVIQKLRLVSILYDKGDYEIGNLKIQIN
jgi:GT2 family glycosyltransferase